MEEREKKSLKGSERRRRERKTSRRHCWPLTMWVYVCIGTRIATNLYIDAALNCKESAAEAVVLMETGVRNSWRSVGKKKGMRKVGNTEKRAPSLDYRSLHLTSSSSVRISRSSE